MRPFVPAVLLTLVVGAIRPAPLCAEVTAEQVRRAIDDGVEYLRKKQNDDGSWPAPIYLQTWAGGVTSLCTLALLNAGLPSADPTIQRALTNLRKVEPKHTYVVALQTMVFCAAEPEKDLPVIRRNAAFLEEIQARDRVPGTWSYGRKDDGSLFGRGDNSNTHFALVALHEAERVGVKTSEATWRLARDHWTRTQNDDGSWGYTEDHQSATGSMTCAGVASLIMAAEKLDEGDARVVGDDVECCGEQTPNEAVERGMHWLTQHFSVTRNSGEQMHLLYYLYGLERVGRLTNCRVIGRHDWYREGAEFLMRIQADRFAGFDRGHWVGTGQGEKEPVVGTSLALLFLTKGRRPVLAAKLDFEPSEHGNHHRHDLANLTDHCGRKWKRELTWQIVESRGASADDLMQAPVLFISGSKAPEFTDAEVQAMREYLDHGGFVFAEAACDDTAAFDAGFRKFMERVFPERDERGQPLHALRLLPPDHAVWAAEEPVDPKYLRPLHGIDVGRRTSVIYCPENLGCYWELDRVGRKASHPPAVEDQIRAARSIGLNVMAYATNRDVKFKLEIPRIEPSAK